MLVLRRRVREAVVFEGALSMTVASLAEQRAWLRFDGPGVAPGVTLSVLSSDGDEACLGIRSPVALHHDGPTARVTVDPRPDDPHQADAVLLLKRRQGAPTEVGGLVLSVAAAGHGQARLRVRAPQLPAEVSITVFSVSGVEVRVGIDAPESLRVYRSEVWSQIRDANKAAARWSPSDLAALDAGASTWGWGRDDGESAGTAGP